MKLRATACLACLVSLELGCFSLSLGPEDGGVVAAERLDWSCTDGGGVDAKVTVACVNDPNRGWSNDCSAVIANGGSYCATLEADGTLSGRPAVDPPAFPKLCHDKLLKIGETDAFSFALPPGTSCDWFYRPVVTDNGEVEDSSP